jgi:hypothetical protein
VQFPKKGLCLILVNTNNTGSRLNWHIGRQAADTVLILSHSGNAANKEQ